MALAITRDEFTADELRVLARQCKATHQARRILAIAMVLDGALRKDAAHAAGMDRQRRRGWRAWSRGR
jgi:hypothetical protein